MELSIENIRKFKASIVAFVNQTQMPTEIKAMCLQDIANQLTIAADNELIVGLENKLSNMEEKLDDVEENVENQ